MRFERRPITTPDRAKPRVAAFLALLLALAVLPAITAGAAPPDGNPATYTLDTHFAEGTLVNVNYDDVPDQLQLDSEATPFNFIWVAVSSEGTVVKIDTNTGAVLGEYRTTPSSQGLGDPSRTTVDNDGSVWVANRIDVSNGFGTVVHIGLLENGQCEDRDGSGTIDTSTGLGNVLAWPDASGTRSVATADDECIVHYTQVNSRGTRHVSVDANNDVWVGGLSLRNFDLVRGGRYDVPTSGTIIRSEASVGFGGYGGLIDGNGVIWSAQSLLRWDTVNPLSGPNGVNWTGYFHDSYGLCIDSSGNVWNTALFGNQIRKFAPDGTLIGTFGHGEDTAQGCVVDGNGHVWVAHSLLPFPVGSTTVGHLLNDGTFIGNVTVGSGPTGVAVDANGKIWATNFFSGTVSRIDPTDGPTGADGVTPVGLVDFTTGNLGGNLYNYSDMTGSTLTAPPTTGTWTVVHDSGEFDAPWSNVSWTSSEPAGSSITVTVASSNNAGGPFSLPETVTNGVDLSSTPPGQFLKVTVTFDRADGFGPSPVLFDITLLYNRAPDCSGAFPSLDSLWPPNHKFVDINVLGVTDPDGDPFTINIDSIFQDEPTDTYGDGSFAPDGMGVGTDTASVRAERSGTKKVPGNGRVYHISFTANDGVGGACMGDVQVGVPHDKKDIPIDDGALYDSTIP
jgi:streptogramin lyase